MKSSMLRSIDLAFSRVDVEKLGALAKLSNTTEAKFLVETVRRTYAQVSGELLKRKTAELKQEFDARAAAELAKVEVRVGGLEEENAISIEEELARR